MSKNSDVIDAEHPLTPIQQGMLFHHLSGGHPGVDLEQIVCDLREELDAKALLGAWQQVVARHEALRTAFRWEGLEAPLARVHASVELPWVQHDWREMPRAQQESRFADLLREDRQRGFDLSRAPLQRFELVRLGDREHRLVWSFHHLLLDGRSFAHVLREVFTRYDARSAPSQVAAPDARPFREHVDFLRARDTSAEEPFWRAELAGFAAPTALALPPPTGPAPEAGHDRAEVQRTLSQATTRALRGVAQAQSVSLNNMVQAAWALLLSRYSGEREVLFGCIRACRRSSVAGAENIVGTFINTLPLRTTADSDAPLTSWVQSIRAQQRRIAPFEQTPLVELQRWCHLPAGRSLFDAILIYDEHVLDGELRDLSGPGREPQSGTGRERHFELHERTVFPLTLYAYGEDELRLKLSWDRVRFGDQAMGQMMGHLANLLESFALHPGARLEEHALLGAQERATRLGAWKTAARVWPRTQTLPDQFEAQVERTPDAVALSCGDESLTYRELDRRANQMAWQLRELGVGAGTLVGLCTDRSVEMVVALLAIHKAGGAYLPLDPSYPSDRLTFQVEDARVRVLITQDETAHLFAGNSGAMLRLDADAAAIAARPHTRPPRAISPADLAYVIYTSGSTGRPKGVMVEHGNVVNFCTGMDERLSARPDGAERLGASPGRVWLAVTSLSFDISVLELVWTLTRGFHVVLYTGEDRTRAPRAAPQRDVGFSLFYFASDESEKSSEKYRLLLEGARWADTHGFEAVWSPERHFHAFGGLYPNPAVTSAAIAAITQRIAIRAGSVVMPLHDPLRVAEEWALVDNLSNGRVGVSFASGWQPNDFVLAPQNYAARKDLMVSGIETVRALWRGEAIERTLADGRVVSVRTLPRPVQKELPVWLTTAGNIDTWRAAGQIGANVLTHLLGQTVEELKEKIAAYRAAWHAAGFGPGEGRVTIMLHTFVGDDDAAVREIVRRPMIEYLRSSVGLIQSFAASFPTFKTNAAGEAEQVSSDFKLLTPEDLEAILGHAFERYFETSGLFGTPATCQKMIDRLEAVGIDEIACLIDFGVDSDLALEHLEPLDRLRRRVARSRSGARAASIPELIAKHAVTHLQCTPSMASMVLAQDGAAQAHAAREDVMSGGEAFPPALARELRDAVGGRIVNMYGPTETTIWSSTYELRGGESTIPIGTPIANTELLVLDARFEPVPVGLPGELYIGGAGVARGYLERPELTAERFIAHPARPDGGRLYRTGDLARLREDGEFEFLGRTDQQVKLRGYRIEMGEIEAALSDLPGVREAAAVVRPDPSGEPRLVAYVSAQAGASLVPSELRAALRERLPEFMIPALVVALDTLPLTPNRKIDRKALPAPEALQAPAARTPRALESDLERSIAQIWQEVLAVPEVGRDDNFFDLGGHSLLTVQVQGRLRRTLGLQAAITDLFRFPTVRSLAEFLVEAPGAGATATAVAPERVQARRDGADRRRLLLERRNKQDERD